MVEQDACRAGEDVFGSVLGEEVLQLHGQLPGASPCFPFNCFHDGSGEEICGPLPPSCCGLVEYRAHGAGERDVEQDLARGVGIMGRQDIDGQEPIEFVAQGSQRASR
ncbi:hypothetical protein [Streptomyces massasporeus]|uniref:hypothetical protein n=1 Tax=Streptomyces massasporeus TaxID=67324 RepID=UPI001672D457|nr:hypothetical protein [Streptomyces massasporeus]